MNNSECCNIPYGVCKYVHFGQNGETPDEARGLYINQVPADEKTPYHEHVEVTTTVTEGFNGRIQP